MRKYATFIVFTFLSFQVCAQEKYYQTDEKATIFDSLTYQVLKQQQIEKFSKISKKAVLDEELVELRRNKDSIIYLYKWHYIIGTSVEEIKEERNAKSNLVGKKFPFEKLKNSPAEENYLGKPTLINLWFTACAPCIDEMPILNKIKQDYGDSVNFLAITYEKSKKVKRFLKKHDFEFLHLTDEKDFLSSLGIMSYPTNIFLDKEGVVIKVEGGIPYENSEKNKMKIGNGKHFRGILDENL